LQTHPPAPNRIADKGLSGQDDTADAQVFGKQACEVLSVKIRSNTVDSVGENEFAGALEAVLRGAAGTTWQYALGSCISKNAKGYKPGLAPLNEFSPAQYLRVLFLHLRA
jgi:hypothetical protein